MNLSTEANVDKSYLQNISLSIISRLIDKQCIAVRYDSRLPCSSHFVNTLFDEYATDGVISEKKLEELLKELKIGRKDEEESDHSDEHGDDHGDDDDDHEGHSHRRRSLAVSEYPLKSLTLGKLLGLHGRFKRATADHDHANHGKTYQKVLNIANLILGGLDSFNYMTTGSLIQIERLHTQCWEVSGIEGVRKVANPEAYAVFGLILRFHMPGRYQQSS